VVVWQGQQTSASSVIVLFDVINYLTGVSLLITFLSKKSNREHNPALLLGSKLVNCGIIANSLYKRLFIFDIYHKLGNMKNIAVKIF
jgi:hypothetical protein